MTRFHVLTLTALAAAAAWAALTGGALRLGGLAALAGLTLLVCGLGVAVPALRFFGPFVCRGPAGLRQVALTFDDGPDPRSTPALLDLLRDAKVPVAFFCVGEKVDAHPDLAARAAREGHQVENHTYRHSPFTNFYPTARLVRELERAQEAVARAAGRRPAYVRPPVGLSNPAVFRAARRLGLRVVGWTVRGLDTGTTTAGRVHARIARRLGPGAIVLLHDGGIPPERLTATVRALLDSLKAGGYTVVRLDRLLGDDGPGNQGNLSPSRNGAKTT
jgi:peptidoglycan/xylan/chitin deacetylase (PgdA/CDA1 family)